MNEMKKQSIRLVVGFGFLLTLLLIGTTPGYAQQSFVEIIRDRMQSDMPMYEKHQSNGFYNISQDIYNDMTADQQEVLRRIAQNPGFAVPQSLGVGSPTVVLDALAKTIAQRFEDEINTQAVSKLKDYLGSPDLKPLALLLPETHRFLANIDVRRYSSFLVSLRDVLEKDLMHLSENYVLSLEYIADSESTPAETRQAICQILLLNEFTTALLRTNDLTSAIALLSTSRHLVSSGNEINSLISVANRSAELLMTSEPRGFVDLTSYFQNSDMSISRFYANYIAGIWLEENRMALESITLKGSGNSHRTLYSVIDAAATEADYALAFVTKLISLATDLRSLPQKLETLNTLRSMRQLTPADLQPVLETLQHSATTLLSLQAVLCDDTKVAAISSKYQQAINDIFDISSAVSSGNYGLAVAKVLNLLRETEIKKETYERIYDVLTFAANASSAKNSDELSSALEAFFLPAGSYWIKRMEPWTVGLQTYTGAAWSNGGGWGLGSPLGMNISYCIAENWSISLFASVIDLGPLVNYRIQQPEGDIPDMSWSDVIAPGGYAVLGLPCFVSLGVGSQLSPYLESIEEEAKILRVTRAWRFQMFLAVDIPLMNLFVSP